MLPYARIPVGEWLSRGLQPSDALVALALCHPAAWDGTARAYQTPTVRTLADWCGMDRKAVMRALARLRTVLPECFRGEHFDPQAVLSQGIPSQGTGEHLGPKKGPNLVPKRDQLGPKKGPTKVPKRDQNQPPPTPPLYGRKDDLNNISPLPPARPNPEGPLGTHAHAHTRTGGRADGENTIDHLQEVKTDTLSKTDEDALRAFVAINCYQTPTGVSNVTLRRLGCLLGSYPHALRHLDEDIARRKRERPGKDPHIVHEKGLNTWLAKMEAMRDAEEQEMKRLRTASVQQGERDQEPETIPDRETLRELLFTSEPRSRKWKPETIEKTIDAQIKGMMRKNRP